MPEETPAPTPTPEPTPLPVTPPPVETVTPVVPDTSTLDALNAIHETLQVFHTTALAGFVLLIVCACVLMVRAL